MGKHYGRRDRDDDSRKTSDRHDVDEEKEEGGHKQETKRKRRHYHYEKKSSRDEKKQRKRHERKRRRRYSDDDSDDDMSGDSESSSSSRSISSADRARKKKKKKRHKHKKKKHKKERKSKSSRDPTDIRATNEFRRNYELADALYKLLQQHPELATELPIMMIRLGGGATLDLSQMTDPSVAQGLNHVFQCLQTFGLQQQQGIWKWSGPANDLVLVKVVRSLLSDVGIHMEAFRALDRKTRQEEEEREAKRAAVARMENKADTNEKEDAAQSHLRQETRKILDTFHKPGFNLSEELAGILQMILQGESIDLDGLPDETLREALKHLFEDVGLQQFEMENDNDEDEEGVAMGYGLANDDDDKAQDTVARSNLLAVLEVCQAPAKPVAPARRVLGPSFPPPTGTAHAHVHVSSSSEEEEVGPAPAGSTLARKRALRGPTLPPPRLLDAKAKATSEHDPTQREEWMMQPGEHELLQGIKSGKTAMKSRTFKNEKQSSQKKVEEEQPIHPDMQAEMDSIHRLHQEARGPSLMEQHKLLQQAKKESSEQEWKWNRESDLDAGRRVDKNALHMVMGGAKDELQSKFQGGYSKGFM